MNIQDIMLRDMQDAEREQSERDERDATSAGDESGFSWLNAAAWLVAALIAMGAAFIAGMCYQVRYHSAEWCDRVEREALRAELEAQGE